MPNSPPTAAYPATYVLPTMLGLLVQWLTQGLQFNLDIRRCERLDAAFKNKMYEGTLTFMPNDPDGSLHFLGRGLDANGNPLTTKNGDHYIRMGPDRKQFGDLPAVEVITNGKSDWRELGFFLLFHRRGEYTGQFYTGVPEYPQIRLVGTRVPEEGLIRWKLDLVPASPAAEPTLAPVPIAAADATTTLRVVKKDTPPPDDRYNW